MRKTTDLLFAAQEALDEFWFIQEIEVFERTDLTLTVRLYIHKGLFVQAFIGEITGHLFFALIEGSRRIFGMDREKGEWHYHPYNDVQQHIHLPEGLGPKPLLSFLNKVEEILLEQDLL